MNVKVNFFISYHRSCQFQTFGELIQSNLILGHKMNNPYRIGGRYVSKKAWHKLQKEGEVPYELAEQVIKIESKNFKDEKEKDLIWGNIRQFHKNHEIISEDSEFESSENDEDYDEEVEFIKESRILKKRIRKPETSGGKMATLRPLKKVLLRLIQLY